jgi:hypothetical protein
MTRPTGNVFFVYQHRKADTGEIFYVGKGHGKRSHSRLRSDYWKRIVASHGLIVEMLAERLSENEAFRIEVETIRLYRAAGIQLANFTDGGEGTVGRITSEASRENYRRSRLGEKNPMFNGTHRPEVVDAIRLAAARNHADPEFKAKHAAALRGIKRSEETKEKIRQARMGTTRSEESRQKMSEAAKRRPSNRKGVKLSEETKMKLRLANLGKKHSEETKRKVAEASRARQANRNAGEDAGE